MADLVAIAAHVEEKHCTVQYDRKALLDSNVGMKSTRWLEVDGILVDEVVAAVVVAELL